MIGAIARALAAIVLLAAGCAATMPDRTGGIRLEIDIRDAGNFAVLYRLDTAGSLGWGGGEGAREGEATWQAELSDAELSGLLAILEEDGWFDSGPAADAPGESSERLTKVRLDGPDGRRRFSLTGRSRAVDRVTEYLEPIARRRYERLLQTFPRPEPGGL